MTGLHLVYVTTPDRDCALAIARAVVTEKLAACGNVLPGVTSVFAWEGRIAEEAECVLVLKTQAARLPALTDRIRSLHPYTVPCIVALPLAPGEGNADFLSWIAGETGGGAPRS